MRTKQKYLASIFFVTFAILSCTVGDNVRKRETEQHQQVTQELLYGRLLSKEILSRYKVYNNPEASVYINKVGRGVALFAGRSELTYYFAILDSETINAFAAPGGYIFITKGSIMAMENEAELAAVLAHEIGHVNNRHIMRQIPLPKGNNIADTIASILVAQGTVVSAAMNETVKKASTLLFENGYRIQDEYEADQSAISYLIETGYDHRALIQFMSRIESIKKADAKLQVYHTHPPTLDRINMINSFLKEQNSASITGKLVTERFQKFKTSIH
ncbi:MAG TPA: M48 family metalloprotease [Spirochaetota bacterium]|nr:M48 family metalloprotease [Spirochaetota bacterium]